MDDEANRGEGGWDTDTTRDCVYTGWHELAAFAVRFAEQLMDGRTTALKLMG